MTDRAASSVPSSRAPVGASDMAVVHGVGALERSLGRLFVVVGVFDGLHRGHEYLLDELRKAALERDARPAVITFDHHPDEVITGKAPPLLCDPDERLQRIEAAGIAAIVVETFDVALRETPFDVWVRRIAERVDLVGFLMTPETAFGYQRGGTPETVAALGRELRFEVAVIPPFSLDGRPVSSSAIRQAIQAGDLAAAERLLGRAYSVVGVGSASRDARAATVAFEMPVAMPPDGTYPVRIEADGAHTAGDEVRGPESPVAEAVAEARGPESPVPEALVRDGRLILLDWAGSGGASRLRVTFQSG
jgi:riboflavin kinase/FMN adenylyltransferase